MDYRKSINRLNDYIRWGIPSVRVSDAKIAVSAMQELQKLHDHGFSLDRMKDIDFRKEIVEHINYDAYVSLQEELEEYKQLGTMEEVQEVVEKHKAKKPKNVKAEGYRYTDTYRCPTCGGNFSGTGIADYCYHCGQKLDWGE